MCEGKVFFADESLKPIFESMLSRRPVVNIRLKTGELQLRMARCARISSLPTTSTTSEKSGRERYIYIYIYIEREREKDMNREFRMPGKTICPSARKAVGIKSRISIQKCKTISKIL